jgi:hypothetical protein
VKYIIFAVTLKQDVYKDSPASAHTYSRSGRTRKVAGAKDTSPIKLSRLRKKGVKLHDFDYTQNIIFVAENILLDFHSES